MESFNGPASRAIEFGDDSGTEILIGLLQSNVIDPIFVGVELEKLTRRHKSGLFNGSKDDFRL
jgi:hypothetical protein